MNFETNHAERQIRKISSGERVLHISYEHFFPGEYEKRVIFGNRCRSLVKMRTIFEGNSADVFYITSGWKSFGEYIPRETKGTQQFLQILLNILQAVWECSTYLVSERELNLIPENIFFSEWDDSVRLLYTPGFQRSSSLAEDIAALTEAAGKICRLGVFRKELIEEYKSRLLNEEFTVRAMIALTEETMRKTFRRDLEVRKEEKCPAGSSADTQPHMVMEESSGYAGGKLIRRHLKDILNEWVS